MILYLWLAHILIPEPDVDFTSNTHTHTYINQICTYLHMRLEIIINLTLYLPERDLPKYFEKEEFENLIPLLIKNYLEH